MKQPILKRTFKFLGLLAALLILLVVIYLIWPVKTVDLKYQYPTVPNSAAELENYVQQKEASIQEIKEGNAAQIVWADSSKTQTDYVLVYLHGFSASHEEGGTVPEQIAEYFGMNLYLSRLSRHGLKGVDGMKTLTAKNLMDSALEAVAIGKSLGKRVILMGTSTGATLGLPIMANDPSIHSGIFYSANINLADSKSDLLTKPFGLSIAKMVLGSDYYSFDPPPGADQYWTTKYPIEATIELQTLLNSTMHEATFEKIKQPVLLVSYYKDEANQDDVVSVQAIRDCYQQLSTREGMKKYVELSSVEGHAMCSPFFSKDVVRPYREAREFMEANLSIWPR